MNRALVGAGIALLFGAPCSTRAQVTGARWVEVDNSSADPLSDGFAGAQWLSQPGWRTFDLFVTGAPGQIVQLVGLGGDNNPLHRLTVTGGVIFNHPAGPNAGRLEAHIAFQQLPLSNLTRFDTYAALGSLNPQGMSDSDIAFAGFSNGLSVNEQGGVIGDWFCNPGIPRPVIDASGLLRILRITVSDSTTSMSGVMAVGLPLGVLLPGVQIPEAIPTPGTAVALALVSLSARRRAGERVNCHGRFPRNES